MRFDEFHNDARKQLAERRDLTEEQLDEILPAIGAVAGMAARAAGTAAVKGGAALARGAVKGATALGRAGAKAAGKAAAGAVKGVAKGATRAAGSAVRGAAKSIAGRGNDDPNATVGTQDEVPMGTQGTQGTQSKPSQIKPGKKLKLPSKTASGKPGPEKAFKITKVQGDDVEIENPMPKPGEPKKFTYNKQDLEQLEK